MWGWLVSGVLALAGVLYFFLNRGSKAQSEGRAAHIEVLDEQVGRLQEAAKEEWKKDAEQDRADAGRVHDRDSALDFLRESFSRGPGPGPGPGR